jgi:hypothetical protein
MGKNTLALFEKCDFFVACPAKKILLYPSLTITKTTLSFCSLYFYTRPVALTHRLYYSGYAF